MAIVEEIHQIEDELAEMDSKGWMKWFMFDTSQLAYWISSRKERIRKLRQELEKESYA